VSDAPRVIQPDEARPPAGHYSHGIVHNDLLFVAGQLPIDPATGRRLTGEPVDVQARQALANLDAVLRAGGSRRHLVLKTTVFVRDIELWDAVNAVYAEFFGAHRPARSIVPTGPLHFGLLVEIEAVAALA
jgi:2-iminobutanoate/2-iminopropanoate deaminase